MVFAKMNDKASITRITTDFYFVLNYFFLAFFGAIIVWLLKKLHRKEICANKYFEEFVKWFALGQQLTAPTQTLINTNKKRYLLRVFMHFGLINLAYISWGIIQERIMTIDYYDSKSNAYHKFQQSEFIVFSNRVFSVVVSCIIIAFSRLKTHINNDAAFPPFYQYSYSTLSNLISSWCQYEALKYVEFPMQVLAKSCKVVPVMIVGTILSRKTYSLRQYLSALGLTVGISIFTFATGSAKHNGESINFQIRLLGYFLLLIYLIGDSFTSNWQSELYRRYSINSIQMMFNCSIIGVIFMAFSFSSKGFSYSATFIRDNPLFLFHLIIFSLCSSIGQIFIFYAIKDVGPVVFTGIMVTRSLISMLASFIIYNHTIPPLGILGVVIIFGILYFEFLYNLKK